MPREKAHLIKDNGVNSRRGDKNATVLICSTIIMSHRPSSVYIGNAPLSKQVRNNWKGVQGSFDSSQVLLPRWMVLKASFARYMRNKKKV